MQMGAQYMDGSGSLSLALPSVPGEFHAEYI